MKAPVFTCFVLMIIAAGPSAAQDRVWIGHSYEEGAALIYGVPDSGDMTLSFDCATKSGTLAFVYAFEPANAVEGAKVDVLLQTGEVNLPVATTGARLEMDDIFILEGEVKFDAMTARLFTSDGVLRIQVGDDSETIPLEGAREAAQALLQTCAPS